MSNEITLTLSDEAMSRIEEMQKHYRWKTQRFIEEGLKSLYKELIVDTNMSRGLSHDMPVPQPVRLGNKERRKGDGEI